MNPFGISHQPLSKSFVPKPGKMPKFLRKPGEGKYWRVYANTTTKPKRAVDLKPIERKHIRDQIDAKRKMGNHPLPREMKSRLGDAGDLRSRYGNIYTGTKGRNPEYGEARTWKKAIGHKMPEGRKVKVKNTKIDQDPFSIMSETVAQSAPNGKGGGIIRMSPKLKGKERKQTLRHEKAHLTPKRNPFRITTINRSQKKSGGEEGRADFIAAGKRTPGEYPGSKKFQRSYDEVQRKMHRAQKRKQT